MAYAQTKQQAHELIERMAPGQIFAVVTVMESMLDPVSRFDPESKKVVQQVLDSMILQQEARRWSAER